MLKQTFLCFHLLVVSTIAVPAGGGKKQEGSTGSAVVSRRNNFGPPPGICILPAYLGYSGEYKFLSECDTLDQFQAPPCSKNYGGNTVKVCCPYPEDPDYPNPDFYLEEAQEACEQTERLPVECDQPTSCLSIHQCGELDTKNPPKFCGIDGSGLGQFCCKEQSGKQSKQPPIFPDVVSKEARPCQDHHPLCGKWKDAHPESCSDHTHPSYEFMNAACMESCGTCKDKGCVDEYEKCPEWTRQGNCSTNPEFMIFNCRESCGTCGFKSVLNQEVQKDLVCGKGKKKDDEDLQKAPTQHDVRHDLCTSVMLSDRLLLTAANCITGSTAKGVRLATIRDSTEHQEAIGIRRSFVHPTYLSGYFYNDMALLELERKVEFDYKKFGDSPPCLSDSLVEEGTATFQGAGINEFEVGGILLEASVNTISNVNCQHWIDNSTSRSFKRMIEIHVTKGLTDTSILCTLGIYNDDRDLYTAPCPGDAGAPLYINTEIDQTTGDFSGQTLAAIHSGGRTCGSYQEPSFWNRIANHREWILCVQEKLQKNLDPETECSSLAIGNPCLDKEGNDICKDPR